MRYRAERDCTDFDGRFYARGQEADLSPETAHSDHLIPLETDPAPEPEETETESEEKEAAPKKARRKTKQAGA
ncbi:hypothetical protein RAH42_10660 [Pyramidobacter sp. YE332]|uniref:hypothetical protein n=1 Tax=Pyramidobacter sp. YE332 TaxID=3068894 RepID=UPI00294B2C51|nr:hypothetical protein [Pyramidobacter sp. YE332]WOL39590.1 hypothetical protein RAH42_10660 [Pyramidobacter sp. YE332]